MEHSYGSEKHERDWKRQLEAVWILGQFKTKSRESAFYPGCDIVMRFAHLVLGVGGTVSGGAEMDSVFPRLKQPSHSYIHGYRSMVILEFPQLFCPTVIFMDIGPWLY